MSFFPFYRIVLYYYNIRIIYIGIDYGILLY